MILPIIAYGNPILKKKAIEIDANYPQLKELIANMFETMYESSGVGLAAPQIGLGIRLFIVDGAPFEEDEVVKKFKKVFINPIITEEFDDKWSFSEGCLSIPGIREDVNRHKKLKITYQNEKFEKFSEEFDGVIARIIQHEYDHLEGVLFIDHLNPLKKRMIKGKLMDISKGKVDIDYRMKFTR
jgi:peptide deformylase